MYHPKNKKACMKWWKRNLVGEHNELVLAQLTLKLWSLLSETEKGIDFLFGRNLKTNVIV